MWAKTKKQPLDASSDKDEHKDEFFTKEYWQNKYEALTVEMEKRDKDIADLKNSVMKALGRNLA
jgi:hypothetical protein